MIQITGGENVVWLETKERALVRLADVRVIMPVKERSSRATEGVGTQIVMIDGAEILTASTMSELKEQIPQ